MGVLMPMRAPRSDGRSNDNGVFIGSHGVLYICRNEQKTADRIRLEVFEIESIAKADFQGTLNDSDSRIRRMPVMLMETRRNKGGIR